MNDEKTISENELLKIETRQLHTLLRFGALVNSSLNIEDVLGTAMKWAEDFTGAQASTIYELDEEADELFIRVARGDKKHLIKNLRLKVGEGIAGHVVLKKAPLIINDTSSDKRFSPKFDTITGFRTRSMICVPLIHKGKITGVIQVLNKKDGKGFTKHDLQLLLGISYQVAVAIENAKLYSRLNKKFELTEEELKRTQEKLLRAERLSAMGNLVQGLAHEIRNPIMTIGGFAKRVQELTDDNKVIKYMSIILDESARLEEILRKIKLFLEVQEPSFESESIYSIVDELEEKYLPLAKEKGVGFEISIPPQLPQIEMDSSQISVAISCLLDNAFDATAEGDSIKLSISQENSILKLQVEDTGRGISQDERDLVFDPFYTSKTRGVGLGLPIVHQIVNNHGGEIKLKSNPGEGTQVSIIIPSSGGKRA